MNKAVVNNEIVLMRKTVRQGKVHIIGKLVRAIRTLKSKKPADGSQKHIQKAERLYEELVTIKKLSCDDISKYALTATDDPQQMLSKTDISIKDRALNRLAAHKFIKEKVKSIKEKHNMNDNIDKILEPGKKKLRKLKHIEGKAKKKQQKLENASAEILDAKRQEWLEKQNPDQKISVGDKVDKVNKRTVSVGGECKNFGKSHDSCQKIVTTDINYVDRKGKVPDDKSEINMEEDSEKEIEEDGENEIEEDSGKEIEEDSDKEIEEDSSIAQSPEENESESEMEHDNKDNVDEIENCADDAVTTVDDFFLTDSGSHYESTFVPKNKITEQIHTDGLNRQQRRAQMHGITIKKKGNKYRNDIPNKREDKMNIKQKTVNPTTRINKPFRNTLNADKPSNILKSAIKDRKEVISESVNTTSLHPSWEAKKKQKPQITAFQGKKIVFDD